MLRHFATQCTVARIGGEEFCIYFEDNDTRGAIERLNAFKQDLESSPVNYESKEINCTISGGLATEHEASLDVLIHKADQYLYEAKSAGRNRIITA
jgi:diguanylate cyclase (GGDEF)-like protein